MYIKLYTHQVSKIFITVNRIFVPRRGEKGGRRSTGKSKYIMQAAPMVVTIILVLDHAGGLCGGGHNFPGLVS
jgi:hypothetical protein